MAMEGFQQHVLAQGDYLLRVLVAAMCGAFIGYEREARLKKAGIRTHTILSMGADGGGFQIRFF